MTNNQSPSELHTPLIAELHSRPFLAMQADARILYLTIQHDPNNSYETTTRELSELCAALDIALPSELGSVFRYQSEKLTLKWERHSEFNSYLLYFPNPKGTPFDHASFDIFPKDWLASTAEQTLSSAIIEITKRSKDLIKTVETHRENFVAESFAAALVLEGAAAIASDFQIDPNGHTRFLLVPSENVGSKRLGRVTQRLVEIETYVVASLLGLPVARKIARKLPEYEEAFQPIIGGISSDQETADDSLHALLKMAAEVEQTLSQTSFRFGASAAYAELVEQRIFVLREQRLANFQLFSEFMLRRYEPGMRTVSSTWERLQAFSARLERAANFLRTKVEVSNSDSQHELLNSMNKRAETQLRLQETVEGLSVVAISYYAVSLTGYLLAPLAKAWHIDKTWLMAISVLPVVLLVWLFIHGIKKRVVKNSETDHL